MPTALKPWQDPATAIPPDAPAQCQIYIIWGLDPWQRGIGEVCLWVGESARFWLLRVSEHADKYWRGDITRIEVVCDPDTGRPATYPTKAAVWKVEEELTKKLQPVHSWEYNRDNPWVVRNMQGVNQPLPQVPEHWHRPVGAGARTSGPVVHMPVRSGQPRPMGVAGKLAWAAAGWLVVAGVVWLLAMQSAQPGREVSPEDGAGLGATAATLLAVGIWWLRQKIKSPLKPAPKRKR